MAGRPRAMFTVIMMHVLAAASFVDATTLEEGTIAIAPLMTTTTVNTTDVEFERVSE